MSAINTIQSVMGINLKTLRPEPSVEGYSTPGGYSAPAVKPIALARCMALGQMIDKEFGGNKRHATLSPFFTLLQRPATTEQSPRSLSTWFTSPLATAPLHARGTAAKLSTADCTRRLTGRRGGEWKRDAACRVSAE